MKELLNYSLEIHIYNSKYVLNDIMQMFVKKLHKYSFHTDTVRRISRRGMSFIFHSVTVKILECSMIKIIRHAID